VSRPPTSDQSEPVTLAPYLPMPSRSSRFSPCWALSIARIDMTIAAGEPRPDQADDGSAQPVRLAADLAAALSPMTGTLTRLSAPLVPNEPGTG